MSEEKKPKLLIVEDDFENQKFLQIFLRRKFDLETCDSAEGFYKKIGESDFDLILMDISLKGKKDGLQLTKELREREKFKNIPVIGLSAHAFQKDKDNAYNAGVDVFLTKPVQNEVLMETLLNSIKKKKSK